MKPPKTKKESFLHYPLHSPGVYYLLTESPVATARVRRSRAAHKGRLGEVEGLDLTLTFLQQKREQTQRLTGVAPVNLGMPGIRPGGPS